MTASTMTITDFITANNLTMKAEAIAQRTDRPAIKKQSVEEAKWQKEASHWRITISKPAAAHVVEYSRGSGHERRWSKGAAAKVLLGGSMYIASERLDVRDGVLVQPKYMRGKTLHLVAMVKDLSEPSPPSLDEVLDCLAIDASSWDNARDLESWCADFGMDSDSRTAEVMYNACGETAKSLRFLLGSAAYTTLTENVERL